MQEYVYIHKVNHKYKQFERKWEINLTMAINFSKESVDGNTEVCHVHTNLEIV